MHRPPGTAHAANSFKTRSLAVRPLCLPAPFVGLFGYSAKCKAIATRATLTGCRGPARLPSALLRFRLPAVLCIFGPSGALSGAFGLRPVYLPGRLLCALSESLCGLPSLPFSIRAATCCSASALPSIAAVLCLPKEERPSGFCRGLLRCCCLLWPCAAMRIRTRDEGRPAALCFSAASLKRGTALRRFACAACLCVCQRTWPGLHL